MSSRGNAQLFSIIGQLRRSITPWNRVNFDLPSAVLARIWRVRTENVHTERTRNERPQPKWKATRNRTLLSNKQFRAAMQSEEEKARRFFGAEPPQAADEARAVEQKIARMS